jgi:retron-type reverse transcriptase
MTGVKWCIEADIDNNFPSISHKILSSILNKRIKCSKFLALIKNYIKTGYVEDNKFHRSDCGLFQGNITSRPILNNIYLHEFDHYIHNFSISFFKGKQRKLHPEYRKILYKINKIDTLTKTEYLEG